MKKKLRNGELIYGSNRRNSIMYLIGTYMYRVPLRHQHGAVSILIPVLWNYFLKNNSCKRNHIKLRLGKYFNILKFCYRIILDFLAFLVLFIKCSCEKLVQKVRRQLFLEKLFVAFIFTVFWYDIIRKMTILKLPHGLEHDATWNHTTSYV